MKKSITAKTISKMHWCKLKAFVCATILGVVASAPATLAWKPTTHVYLAEEALKDALDDGKVTIYAVDYTNGQVTDQVIGEFEVSPVILQALKDYSAQYRAGVLGPDAYPDMLTGQQVIHPQKADSWLKHLWDSSWNDANEPKDPQWLAFVLGYMTHAAGDMYAHTFVNYFTGDHFTFNPQTNALKHIVLEKYIDKKAPPPPYDASIAGVENFIYEQMINATPGSYLDKELLRQGDKNTNSSVPRIYSTLRARLQSNIDAYYAKKSDFDRRISDKKNAAKKCKLQDFSCSKAALYAQAAAIGTQKAAYIAANGLLVTYQEHWRDDIDKGLKAWAGVSHEVAKALFFNPEKKTNVEQAEKILVDYASNHLISMSGAPDATGQFAGLYYQVVRTLPKEIKDSLDKVNPITKAKNKIYDFVIKEATGMTREELKKYLTQPERYFDQVMRQSPGTSVNRQTFDSEYLKLNRQEFFDYRKVPAAYNTVTMSKLIMLDRYGVNQLLAKLNNSSMAKAQIVDSPQQKEFKQDNIMLGFINTLDGDNEWSGNGKPPHPDKKMVLAECELYTQIFMKQPGDEASACQVAVQPTSNEVCVDVDSTKGWQHYTLPGSFTRVASVSGSWSVDDRNYRRVGEAGHSEPGLEPYNQYKLDQGYPFGALLVNIPNYGYVGVKQGQELPRPINETDIRINDGDNALGDNGGTLKVCFGS